jgi:hypothetical protein
MKGSATMNKFSVFKPNHPIISYLWLLIGAVFAVLAGWLIAKMEIKGLILVVGIPFSLAFLIGVFKKPKIGVIALIYYSFFFHYLGKHAEGPKYGLLVDGLLVLTWLGVIFYRGNRFRFRHNNIDLMWLSVGWFALTVLEMGNPSRPSFQGWVQEVRSISLYWLLLTPLTILLFNKKSDIPLFLHIIIFISFLGALYGIKQLYFGVDAAEMAWLESGAKKTHVLFGKLRVFSFYAEAAQFGASQACIGVSAITLAVGPYTKSRKMLYLIAGLFILYGMVISGTRGAMGGLIGGGFIFLVLTKQVRIIILGAIVGGIFVGFLKFTTIGNDNSQIRRLRSSLDPNDASLQVRLINQRIFRDALASKPFGTGVGTIGMWGSEYNKHIPTAKIPPDSLYVKVWVMYGVIGFIIWLGIMLYIVGKSCGIIWETQDPVLKNQLIALCAGSFGSLVCSYGNEVMNALPSLIVVCMSWAFVFISPKWDNTLGQVKPQND